MRVYPWHSIKPYAPHIYHNETRCKTGNNIEAKNAIRHRHSASMQGVR